MAANNYSWSTFGLSFAAILFLFGCGPREAPGKAAHTASQAIKTAEKAAVATQSPSAGAVAVGSSTAPLVPQKSCPAMRGPINKSLYYDYNGKRIYVCCAVCLKAIHKDPEKYLKELAKMGEEAETIAK